MNIDVNLMLTAQKMRDVIHRAADRRGSPGAVKAARLEHNLVDALSADDVSETKKAILAIVNHSFKPRYFTEEEQSALDAAIKELPDDVKTRIMDGEKTDAATKKALTLGDVESYLDREGITLRYNEITHEFENGGRDADDLTTKIHSDLVNEFTRVSPDIIERYETYISRQNRYNPVLEKIESITWDGRDRIDELCDIIRIDKGDELSRILVRRWIYQAMAMALNTTDEQIAGQGVLVLQSPQNAGKSTLCRKLAFEDASLYTDAALRVDNRDSVARITAKWICELSELGRMFRGNDGDALKQFLTSPKDEFRLPYAKHDEKRPRKVSFIGTLNPKRGDRRYLTDDGGDRRYWTVICNVQDGEQFDFEAEDKLDFVQLWRQAHEEVQAHGAAAYMLGADEVKMLVRRNRDYMLSVPGEDELRDIIETAKRRDRNGKSRFKTAPQTATEIKQNFDSLKNLTVEKIGAALQRLGYEQDRRRRYNFPCPVYSKLSAEDTTDEDETGCGEV